MSHHVCWLSFGLLLTIAFISHQKSVFHREKQNSSNQTLISIDFECPIDENTYIVVSRTTEDQQKSIHQQATQVSNSDDVLRLLDHVNWRIFIYSCAQACVNFSFSAYRFQNACSNNTLCSFSDSINDILRLSFQCGNTSCATSFDSHLIMKWYIFFVFGLFSFIGNIVVISDKTISLRKRQNKEKEIQIYHALVLNLALADLLMGIYLTAISFEIKQKVRLDILFSKPTLCNGLAIISIVSSQVSITTLLIISVYRLAGVVKPFKKQHFKSVIILIILMWVLWLAVAILPIMPLESLEATFILGIVRELQFDKNSFIIFSDIVFFVFEPLMKSLGNVTELKSVIHAVNQFPTPSVMTKFCTAVGWVNLEEEDWTFWGVYSGQYSCSLNFVIVNRDDQTYQNYFKSTFVLYNLIVSAVILICYILVTIKIYEKDSFCFNLRKVFRNNNASLQAENSARNVESRQMFKRISLIVVTDLMCWVPMCIASITIWNVPFEEFFALFGSTSEDYLTITLLIETILLTAASLNSVLNPYIYSWYLWKKLFEKIRKIFVAN